ncbi:hypothetical protein [Pseudalkalibacillus berkeleyi]|uniref:Ferric oxidoreductase domain-containing protein n=1 Tax=Pseudalkalibacillus berkeleyi TaxID=1069813 RepID=A0ABS9H696_9BACL|nr:hypothetical protein [Pseudalkalibacillus berkeleyi]MCF6139387.1 hypothetical protein [Pseudalkalibacillus berkeleyi]
MWRSTGITIILFMPWFIYMFSRPYNLSTAILWAYTALSCFVLAFILYIFLRLIGRLGRTDMRRKLVVFTRVYIRFHIAIALIGVASLFMHMKYMLSNGWASTLTGQLGLVAVAALVALLATGYLRKIKSSGKRRRYHRYASYIFLLITILHMLI